MSRILVLLLCFSTLSAGAATYYLDANNGSDAADGLSPANAWQSISKMTNAVYGGAASFGGGDTVLFRGTNGAGQINIWYGTAFFKTNGMTFGCYDCFWNTADWFNSVLPIIDGGRTNRHGVSTLTFSNTTTWGLRIRNNGGGTGANWQNNNGTNILRYSVLHTNASDALATSSTESIVHDCWMGGAFDEALTTHTTARMLATNCWIQDCSTAVNNSGTFMTTIISGCYFTNCDTFIGPLSLCTTAIVENSIFRGLIAGGANKKFFDIQATNVIVRSCIFDASNLTGEQGSIPVATNMPIMNSVFYGNPSGRSGFIGIQDAGCLGLTNCILLNWARACYFFAGTAVADHTFWVNVGISNLSANATSMFTVDPRMVNPDSGNFRLDKLSAGLNAGVNVGILRDIEGRLIVNPPDIGAYEFWNPSQYIGGNVSIR